MEYSLIAAGLGSVCLSLMIIFDRLMMGDCYKNNSDHAWVISSLAGAVFGLSATALTWAGYSFFTDATLITLLNTFTELWWPSGILLCLVGIINIQVMRHYFRLFIPGPNEEVNETGIAMWLAAVPIFIFITIFTLNTLGLTNGILSGLEKANSSLWFGLLVGITILAMISFEKVSNPDGSLQLKRFSEIAKMLGCIVFYTILSSSILRAEEMDVASALALQPFYWLGFAAGARYLFSHQHRQAFANNWQTIKIYLIPILVVEVIGMSVYYFEFFALSGSDPTIVNLITGAHIILVFIFTIQLTRLHHHMAAAGEQQRWYFGLSFTKNKLPSKYASRRKIIWFILVVISLLVTTYFA